MKTKSKTLDDHLQRLMQQLNVEKLVSQATEDKAGALEREGNKIIRIGYELMTIGETAIEAVRQFRYLNETFPDEKFGDRLFDASFVALRQHELNVRDLASVVDYAAARVELHAPGGSYDRKYYEADKRLVELPQMVAQLTQNARGAARYFLIYLKAEALEAQLEQLPQLFSEFKEIVIDGILAAGAYAGILRVRGLGGSWEDIRSGRADDAEAKKWIEVFENLERRYPHRDLPRIEKLYKKSEEQS